MTLVSALALLTAFLVMWLIFDICATRKKHFKGRRMP